MGLTIGIDAANLRSGGGMTHLVEVLAALQPSTLGIQRVVVWGSATLLAGMACHAWLDKRNPDSLEKGLMRRALWQRCRLSQVARAEGCDVLFVPGGSHVGNFHPVVVMSQSLLPFDEVERGRYGHTLFALKLLLLNLIQTHSFRKADGVIFLTEHAKEVVMKAVGHLRGRTSVIAHGVHPRFRHAVRPQPAAADRDDSRPFRILYVATVDMYKHQWHLVEAVHLLREKGVPVALDMIGGAYPPALARLNDALARFDPGRQWASYHGPVPHEALHEIYERADLMVCASSCEAFGLTLLESMAAGLPLVCSDKKPMSELVADAGVYFNPEQPADIARALLCVIESPFLREALSRAGIQRARAYSWQRCAQETFAFLAQVALQEKGVKDVQE